MTYHSNTAEHYVLPQSLDPGIFEHASYLPKVRIDNLKISTRFHYFLNGPVVLPRTYLLHGRNNAFYLHWKHETSVSNSDQRSESELSSMISSGATAILGHDAKGFRSIQEHLDSNAREKHPLVPSKELKHRRRFAMHLDNALKRYPDAELSIKYAKLPPFTDMMRKYLMSEYEITEETWKSIDRRLHDECEEWTNNSAPPTQPLNTWNRSVLSRAIKNSQDNNLPNDIVLQKKDVLLDAAARVYAEGFSASEIVRNSQHFGNTVARTPSLFDSHVASHSSELIGDKNIILALVDWQAFGNWDWKEMLAELGPESTSLLANTRRQYLEKRQFYLNQLAKKTTQADLDQARGALVNQIVKLFDALVDCEELYVNNKHNHRIPAILDSLKDNVAIKFLTGVAARAPGGIGKTASAVGDFGLIYDIAKSARQETQKERRELLTKNMKRQLNVIVESALYSNFSASKQDTPENKIDSK